MTCVAVILILVALTCIKSVRKENGEEKGSSRKVDK